MKPHRGNLQHSDYSGKYLVGHVFEKCNLNDVSFKHADLTGAVFNNCQGEGLLFTGASLKGVTIENCSFTFSDFEHADLRESHLVSLDLSWSALTGCQFDKAVIDNLTVKNCEMNMASFVGARIYSIDFLPKLSYGFMRGIGLFTAGKMHHNQVFINGNSHLAFVDYCRREATVERIISRVEEDHKWYTRPLRVIGLCLFYFISDFGWSFYRWLIFLLGIVGSFAFLYCIQLGLEPLLALNISLHAFFSLDLDQLTDLTSWLFLAESVTGYFMLGVLVSMLTNKIISN